MVVGYPWFVVTCWLSMVIIGYGYQWLSWFPVVGFQWLSLVSSGYPWFPVVILGFQSTLGFQWLYLVLVIPLVSIGYRWLSLVFSGYPWFSVVIVGYLWF